MANQLEMAKHCSIIGLARLGWSYRRIATAVKVDRQTVARHVAKESVSQGVGPTDSNATISITGSTPVAAGRRSRCEALRAVIVEGLERGLTARRIWQDLVADHGYADGYQTVQRFIRRLGQSTPLPFRRMESNPGEEAQVDFGKGAPIVDSAGRRRRPHLFRIVLSCSRKAYSEVVLRQTTEQFLRCIENAFWHFGGVTHTLVIDNLKAAVSRADWYDPELNPKIESFCRHYQTTIVPTRPYTPRHKGKVERGVGYAQSNALKGRTFANLDEQNRFLAEWEATVADTRIHGTTRQQVGKLFVELEKPALLPLPAGRFTCFQEGQRIVSRDGHVEVAKAYYSAPPEFVGRSVWVRWDGRVVRLFDDKMRQIGIHVQHEPGRFSTDAGHIDPRKRGGIERGATWWLTRIRNIGPCAALWAQSVIQQRGVHGVRVLMGMASLTHHHLPSAIERACQVAQSHNVHRLRDIRHLLKHAEVPIQQQLDFAADHPLIRPLSEYDQLVRAGFDKTVVTRFSYTRERQQ
jgi:transposase